MRLRMSRFLCLCHKCEHSYAYVYAYVTSVNQPLGTTKCPCYTACSMNLIRIIPKKIFAMVNQRKRFFHGLRLHFFCS